MAKMPWPDGWRVGTARKRLCPLIFDSVRNLVCRLLLEIVWWLRWPLGGCREFPAELPRKKPKRIRLDLAMQAKILNYTIISFAGSSFLSRQDNREPILAEPGDEAEE